MIKILKLLASFLLFSYSIFAEVNGHEKLFYIFQDTSKISNLKNSETSHILINQLRFNFQQGPFFFSHDLNLMAGFGKELTRKDLGVMKPRFRLFSIENSQISLAQKNLIIDHNLDRLKFLFSFSRFDISVGRQAFSFGSARFVNPTDPLKNTGFNFIDEEYRPGLDGVSLVYHLSHLSELELAYIGDEEISLTSPKVIRFKNNFVQHDLEFILIFFYGRTLFGGSGEGSFFESGYYWEASLVEDPVETNFFRASLGIVHQFSNDLFLNIEYHYNGIGRQDRFLKLDDISKNFAYKKAGVFLLRENYLFSSLSKSFSSIHQLSATSAYSFDDRSIINALRFQYSINSELYLNFSSMFSYLFTAKSNQDTNEFIGFPTQLSFGLFYYW